jgi:hypothetical protein
MIFSRKKFKMAEGIIFLESNHFYASAVGTNLFSAENQIAVGFLRPSKVDLCIISSYDLQSVCRSLNSAGESAQNPRLHCSVTGGNADIGSDLCRPVDPKIKPVTQHRRLGETEEVRETFRK